MKSYFILALISLLGITLVLGGIALWHISSTTEFSRSDQPPAESR